MPAYFEVILILLPEISISKKNRSIYLALSCPLGACYYTSTFSFFSFNNVNDVLIPGMTKKNIANYN